jgi:hypothetical protein
VPESFIPLQSPFKVLPPKFFSALETGDYRSETDLGYMRDISECLDTILRPT